MGIIVFNSGSATLKFALYEDDTGHAPALRGLVEQFGPQALLCMDVEGVRSTCRLALHDSEAAAVEVLRRLSARRGARPPRAVAHRFVHGGARHRAPLRLDAATLTELEQLIPLAPLHMGPALAVARYTSAHFGEEVPAFGMFDTAYFHDLPAPSREYALPRDLVEQHGLRRYGFHGLAHRSLYERYCTEIGADPLRARVVSFQLGHGCSAAAIAGGRALDTSMGLTPLEGLVMGTRGGDIGPGVLIRLLRGGMTVDELEATLQHRSGLLGLSDVSSDMRQLLELDREGHPGAQLAVETFCHRVRKYLGAYLSLLDGAEAVLFGGGIGENAPEIRRRCIDGFAWAGLHIDEERNRHGLGRISADGSRLHAYVLTTDEERVIAADAVTALAATH